MFKPFSWPVNAKIFVYVYIILAIFIKLYYLGMDFIYVYTYVCRLLINSDSFVTAPMKTHNSESRGQEEAQQPMQLLSELITRSTTLKLTNALAKLP